MLVLPIYLFGFWCVSIWYLSFRSRVEIVNETLTGK